MMQPSYNHRSFFERVGKPDLPSVLLALAVLLLLFQSGAALLENIRAASAAVRFPYPLEYGEGPVLDQVMRLSRGENIYDADLSTPPFTITTRPPLFLALQTPFAQAFGPAYWYGRAIALVSALAAAVLVGLTLYTLTRDWVAAAAGGLTLLAFPYLMHWAALDHADTLALALSWGGLYSLVRWPDRRRGWIAPAVLFALAVAARQTYILAGPLAAAAWLVQQRRRRQAALLVGLTAGLCLALFLVINAWTGGGFYFNLFTAANAAPFSWRQAFASTIQLLPHIYYLAIGTFLFLIIERQGERTASWPLVLPYCVGAAAAGAFSGRGVATVSPFIELAAALSLAAGAIIAWGSMSRWLKLVLIVFLAAQIGTLTTWAREEYVPRVMDRAAAQDNLAEIYQQVRAAEGPLLADEFNGLAPLAGKRLYYQPVEFMALNQAGLWDERVLIGAVQRQDFPIIMLYIPPEQGNILTLRWPPAVRSAIWDNYELVNRLASVYVYVPRQD